MLFDINSDPHEIKNLALDPEYQGVLSRLRKELDSWLASDELFVDKPEAEMVNEIWPNMEQPVTPSPIIVRAEDYKVSITNTLDGASIGYRILPNQD